MSGIGALAVEKGRIEGIIKALYYDAGFNIEKIAETAKMPEDEIRVILTLKGTDDE